MSNNGDLDNIKVIPFFSIVITTYNRAEYIVETLNSCFNQTYKSFEVILVDDGSTDDTKSKIKPFLNYPNFIYYFQENKERGAARNVGINFSNGHYIKFLDSDDILLPYCLKVMYDNISKSKSIDVFHSNTFLFGNGKLKSTSKKGLQGYIFDKLWKENDISFSSTLVKKKVFDTHMFNENRKLSGVEDYHLWLKLAMSNCKFHFISKPIVKYRVGSKGNTMDDIDKLYNSSMFLLNDFKRNNKVGLKNEKKFISRLYYLKAIYAINDFNKKVSWNNCKKFLSYDSSKILEKSVWILFFKLLIPTPIFKKLRN